MEPSEARDWGRGLATMGQVRQWEWLGVLPSTAVGQGTGTAEGGGEGRSWGSCGPGAGYWLALPTQDLVATAEKVTTTDKKKK